MTVATPTLAPAEKMTIVGQLANQYAAGATFTDYTQRKAPKTVKSQRFDLACFAEYLATAGRHSRH